MCRRKYSQILFWKTKLSIFKEQLSKVLYSLFLLYAELEAIEIYPS